MIIIIESNDGARLVIYVCAFEVVVVALIFYVVILFASFDFDARTQEHILIYL